jgi:hypothetical protein
MYYTFRQTNSYGRFEFDMVNGISVNVIIEATSHEEANEIAQVIGIYFDDGYMRDCQCCGPRWRAVDEYDAEAEPSVYGQSVYEPGFQMSSSQARRYDDGYPEGFIHHMDGRIEAINAPAGGLFEMVDVEVVPWPPEGGLRAVA